MKLKLLVVPFVAILTVYLVIWQIVPAYFGPEGVDAYRQGLEKINQKLVDIENKNANAAKLASALNYNAEQQVVLRQYLPEKKKDEEIINSLSSIASQNGISIVNIGVGDISSAMSAEESNLVNEQLSDPTFDMGVDGLIFEDVIVSNENLLQEFNVDTTAVGSYENTRKFIVELTKLKRFNEIVSLKISPNLDSEDLFTTNMVIKFNYLNKVTSVANVDKKIFEDENFDMSVIKEINDATSADISTVDIGSVGRTNLFSL